MSLLAKLVSSLVGGLSGAIGSRMGSTVANGAALAAFLAAATPLILWYRAGGNNEIAVTISLTYGEAFFFAVVAFVIIKVSQYTPPPRGELRTRVIDRDAE